MNVNVETAVRICPLQCLTTGDADMVCVQSNSYHNTIHLGAASIYPVNYALPTDCNQSQLYTSVVSPLLNYILEGCDISVVTVGQSGTGKTYTLLGPGLSCASSVDDYGIIPRFLRDLFALLNETYKDRTATIHLTWSQICGENVQDLLGAGTGSVECKSVTEAFQLIQLGMMNSAPRCAHTLFTVTLEQQWLLDNKVQHRVSTASFADLAGSEKIIVLDSNGCPQTIPSDLGLLALQKCVVALTDPNVPSSAIPYNQSVLTTLLRDSFGGRAKTVLISCISPLVRDLAETFYTLQFIHSAQMIRNTVTINSYTTNEAFAENLDVFGLQFAANQLFKLVANAEELFQRLVSNGSLNKLDLEQISHWLTLKQECEECLSENSEPHRSLERIEEEEDIEDSYESSEAESQDETPEQLLDRLEVHLKQFRISTNALVKKENGSTIFTTNSNANQSLNSSNNSQYHTLGARGRRTSVHSADDFTNTSTSLNTPLKITEEEETAQNKADNKKSTESKQKILAQICTDLKGRQRQIEELENTIAVKEKLKQQLLKHIDTKNHAREKIAEKCAQLKNDQENVQSTLAQVKLQNNKSLEEKIKRDLAGMDQELQNLESIKEITEDSLQKVRELESSLHTSRKQLDRLKKLRRKEEKRKASYENQIKRGKKLSQSQETGSSRDESHALVLMVNDTSLFEDNDRLEALRHEIRNLRRTRELLIDQRCAMDARITKHHSSHQSQQPRINDAEERRLLQYEEAIEAIDLAIEYKNQLMCGGRECFSTAASAGNGSPASPGGHVVAGSSTQLQHEHTDKMLIERLLKLDENEMRTLVHRYFEKVIDLRCSSKKLELQVLDIESQNEHLTSRVQSLSHTLQQVRLESERRVVYMQKKHEEKLHVIMSYIANYCPSNGPVLPPFGGGAGTISGTMAGGTQMVNGNEQLVNTKVTKKGHKLIIQQQQKK